MERDEGGGRGEFMRIYVGTGPFPARARARARKSYEKGGKLRVKRGAILIASPSSRGPLPFLLLRLLAVRWSPLFDEQKDHGGFPLFSIWRGDDRKKEGGEEGRRQVDR